MGLYAKNEDAEMQNHYGPLKLKSAMRMVPSVFGAVEITYST
jgi:hypothetical protein